MTELGISPGTLPALHVPLISGRNLDDRDNAKGLGVAIVNQEFVRKLFPHQNPIGKRFKGGYLSDWTTIIGVVGNVKSSSLDASLI